MLDNNGTRQLAYVARIDEIKPIEGRDRVECAYIGGWTVMVRKGIFKEGGLGIYFEPDSKVPEKEPYMFLASKHFKVKIQKYKTPSGHFYSQGLLMHPSDFCWMYNVAEANKDCIIDSNDVVHYVDDESKFLTKELGVVYADPDDNKRKANKPDSNAKYKSMMARHPKFAKTKIARWCMKRDWAKKILYFFLGRKKDNPKGWPVGKFPGVSKTDQERVENMTWVLNDKTPFIKTQKCDGSSGTYILERKGRNKFEFYVCSRNVRMRDQKQECFYGEHNYYWEVAEKYDIENKMKDYLNKNKDISFVCWQGEICAPAIQKNPHRLTETHFYAFHMTDSKNGRYDIREAKKIWDSYLIETVPIVCDNYIMPDDFEEFKKSADGFYDSEVCEGYKDCPREGFVYYKTDDPTFSFKNVSREYLLNH